MGNRDFTRSARQTGIGMILFLLFTVFLIPYAHAHKMTVFAWVDGDRIHTQSKFSRGKRVKNAPVEVLNLKGQLVVQGMTDEDGMYSFAIPSRETLKITVRAGMGHQASWTVTEEELMDIPEKGMPEKPGTATESGAAARPSGYPYQAADNVQLKEIVEKALDKKLKPVIKLLAESRDSTSLKDIMGGLGYILGLMGVAAYFSSRRKNGR